MTNFIEQMMKTAGVETRPKCTKKRKCEDYNCINCDKQGYKYPTFTAEKQLELIKLISNKLGTPGIDIIFFDGTYNFYTGLRFGSSHQDFAQALAQLTTKLMKAGELDKEKVREIFEK